MKRLNNIPVRFFVVDYDNAEVDLIEVDEIQFIAAEGKISYERNTIFNNGVNQICLTKGVE